MKLPAVPPEGFLLAMPEEERERLGRAGLTQAQAEAKYAAGEERKLQQDIYQWLLYQDIYFEWDRMDKRTSGKRGRADFRICVPANGHWLSLEAKVGNETLSPEQEAQAARLRRSGGIFAVVRSLREAIDAVRAAQKII